MKGAGMAAYTELGARGVEVDGGVAGVAGIAVVDAEASGATSGWRRRPRLLYYSPATHTLTQSQSHTFTHSNRFTH